MTRIIISGYTITPDQKGAAVGKLKAVGDWNNMVLFNLNRDPSDKFEIKNDLLKLKNDRMLCSGESPFYYDISITAEGNNQIKTEEFRIVRDDFLRNGVVAHRGAHNHGSGNPNSMTAFKDAVKKGFTAFECDVLFSKEKRVVVAHGSGTGHDGGKPDIPIYSSTYEQLSQVDLGNRDCIPLLEDVLREVMKQNRTGIVIEVKETEDGNDLQLARRVYDIVRNLKAQAWAQFISFNYEQLREILKMDEYAKCSPLEHCRTDVSEYVNDGMWGVDFHKDTYNKKLVRECKKAGLQLNSWTVNEQKIMKKFKDWGFNLITTDEPEECLKMD